MEAWPRAGSQGRLPRGGGQAKRGPRGGPWQRRKATSGPAPTKPLVELLHLAREPQLREVPGVDEHVAVRHLDGVRPRVGVRHADKAGIAGRLGGIVRHGVHPAGREDTAGGVRPARGPSTAHGPASHGHRRRARTSRWALGAPSPDSPACWLSKTCVPLSLSFPSVTWGPQGLKEVTTEWRAPVGTVRLRRALWLPRPFPSSTLFR